MEVDSRSYSCIFGLARASDPCTAETIGREMAKIGSQGRAQHSYYICSVSQQSPQQEPLMFTGSGQRVSPFSLTVRDTEQGLSEAVRWVLKVSDTAVERGCSPAALCWMQLLRAVPCSVWARVWVTKTPIWLLALSVVVTGSQGSCLS